MAAIIPGWATAMLGNPESGVAEGQRGQREWLATGARFWLPYFHGLLADGLAREGQAEEALAALGEGLAWVARTGERWSEAELLRRKGEVLARLGDVPGAVVALEEALRVARGQEALMWELRAVTSLCRLWAEGGERRKAHDTLVLVYGRFTEGFDTPDLRNTRALLDAPR